MIELKDHFPHQRRLMAAASAAVLVYVIVNLLGKFIGISEGVEKNTLYLIILSTTVSAYATKYVLLKFKLRTATL